MREIKFRFWDNIRNRYGEVMNVDFLGKCGIIQTAYLHGAGTDDWWECNLSGGVLEQYTGLKDKNGREIYDGDIVKTVLLSDEAGMGLADEYSIGVVEFNNGTFTFGNRQWKDGTHDWYSIENSDMTTTEVIGNIHENKELLANG